MADPALMRIGLNIIRAHNMAVESLMILRALAAYSVLMLLSAQSAFAASPTINCRHLQGEELLGSEVKLERSGNWITVTSVKQAPDTWTFRVAFEHPAIGYRAIRAGRTTSTAQSLDVEYGGELFLTTQDGEQRLFVTAVQVMRSRVTSQLLTCRDAP